MQINIKADPKKGCPPFAGVLDPVTVFMGANGTGKSKLISAIIRNLEKTIGITNVIRFIPTPRIGPVDLGVHQQETNALSSYNHSKTNSGSNDSSVGISNHSQVMALLHARDGTKKEKLYEAVKAYNKNPENNPSPIAEKLEIDELIETFNSIFEVQLRKQAKSGVIFCESKHGKAPYKLDSMSSGESWGFFVLPELIARKNDEVVVVVDEPESFLNEQLACEFWSIVEARNPKWKFIYATHNPSFASRSNVSSTYLLTSTISQPTPITDWNDIPELQRTKLLGVAPRLLSSFKTIFVEGKDTSFDKEFYKSIIGVEDIDIQPLENCEEVRKATTHTGYWKHLPFDNVMVSGIIDRDFIEDVSSTESLLMLNFHDAEAYLAHPELLARIAKIISGPEQSADFYREKIVAYAKRSLGGTIRQYLNRQFRFGDNISLTKAELGSCDPDEVAKAYFGKRDELIAAAKGALSDEIISSKAADWISKITKAVDEKSIGDILVYFNGKAILQEVIKHSGLNTKIQGAQVIADNDLVNDFKHLWTLRADILRSFSDTEEPIENVAQNIMETSKKVDAEFVPATSSGIKIQ